MLLLIQVSLTTSDLKFSKEEYNIGQIFGVVTDIQVSTYDGNMHVHTCGHCMEYIFFMIE
jgi:hypothetical protein